MVSSKISKDIDLFRGTSFFKVGPILTELHTKYKQATSWQRVHSKLCYWPSSVLLHIYLEIFPFLESLFLQNSTRKRDEKNCRLVKKASKGGKESKKKIEITQLEAKHALSVPNPDRVTHINLLISHSHANWPKQVQKEDLVKKKGKKKHKQTNKQGKKKVCVFHYWMVSLKG